MVTGVTRLGANLPAWVAADLAPDGLTEAAGRISVNSATATADRHSMPRGLARSGSTPTGPAAVA